MGAAVVGVIVGVIVGLSVGVIVGLSVGAIVGLTVGDSVGDSVGLSVGAIVGAIVGSGVGSGHVSAGKTLYSLVKLVDDPNANCSYSFLPQHAMASYVVNKHVNSHPSDILSPYCMPTIDGLFVCVVPKSIPNCP